MTSCSANRAIDPASFTTESDADFRYVNVAVWDSEDAFRAATSRPEFRDISTEYPLHSSVYEVVSADQRWIPGAL